MSGPLKEFQYPADLAAIEARLYPESGESSRVIEAVTGILASIRSDGDAALVKLTQQFDQVDLTAVGLRVGAGELQTAWEDQTDDFRAAIDFAAEGIRRFHEAQIPREVKLKHADGTVLRRVARPIGRVGVYVPGGSAAYPSTVLMNVIPALVAGVKEIALVTPPVRKGGPASATSLAAAHFLGITEVYRVGGAQAVAALAYGTETIRRVDKIIGPGNAFVNEAKKQVYGQVDIDSLAGPSEILVIADETERPDWIAADLLSQAEHSPDAQSILCFIGSETRLAEIQAEVLRQTETAPRREIIEKSLTDFGTAVVVESRGAAIEFANWKAPEHLEILTAQPDEIAEQITTAGAVFVGPWTPEAVCDYVAGPNHVLPTGGTARFASGLSTSSFLRGMNITRVSREGLRVAAPYVRVLAETEGLPAHSASVQFRFDGE